MLPCNCNRRFTLEGPHAPYCAIMTRNQQKQRADDLMKKLSNVPPLAFENVTSDADDVYYLTPDEVKLVNDGQPILAIKAVRERAMCSLLCAKRNVDKYREALQKLVRVPCRTCSGKGYSLETPNQKGS